MSSAPPNDHGTSLKCSIPISGNWDSAHTTIGAGVAIFHLASARVVVCFHSVDQYWFLPKGRRDAGEDSGAGAEREGYEESGYRNRLLPLPLPTRQPRPHHPSAPPSRFITEPIWTQLVPVSRSSQYILFWYIAETLPPDLENQLSRQETEQGMAYQYPSCFDAVTTLKQRMELDGEGYEPVRHEGTGVNSEEALYESHLLPIEEAIEKLGRSVMADVVRKGWEGICTRRKLEEMSE